jgi:hypothetical protein
MRRKWTQYRTLFYASRLFSFLLLVLLTVYVLIVPAPLIEHRSSLSTRWLTSNIFQHFLTSIRWMIIVLSIVNLLNIIIEIVVFRGLRVPFAQLFGMIAFATSIIAFLFYNDHHPTDEILSRQWQMTSFAILMQWFNAAVILRSMPFVGNFIVMLESILMNFIRLILIMLPLHVAFALAIQMLFFDHAAFATIFHSIHKLWAMLVGELDYEILFFSKPTFTAASIVFIPFFVMMTIASMNLLLGMTVGDIKSSMENARAKASKHIESIVVHCLLIDCLV